MSEKIDWVWLDIDVPISRDFIALEEQKLKRAMTRAEAKEYIKAEFHFNDARSKVIVDTIKGEERADRK